MVGYSVLGWAGGGRVCGQRVKGIEPSSLAWKAIALPLSYTRMRVFAGFSRLLAPGAVASVALCCSLRSCFSGETGFSGNWGVQDSNLRRQCHQIYSLTPLTARETPRLACLGCSRKEAPVSQSISRLPLHLGGRCYGESPCGGLGSHARALQTGLPRKRHLTDRVVRRSRLLASAREPADRMRDRARVS